MLTKRIIPCLDVKNGRTVKGINFQNLVDAGDPAELAARYSSEGADELVLLDITATLEGRKTFLTTVEAVARQVQQGHRPHLGGAQRLLRAPEHRGGHVPHLCVAALQRHAPAHLAAQLQHAAAHPQRRAGEADQQDRRGALPHLG